MDNVNEIIEICEAAIPGSVAMDCSDCSSIEEMEAKLGVDADKPAVETPNRYRDHAIRELGLTEGIVLELKDEIIEFASSFSKLGLSGGVVHFYANAIANAVKKIMLFEPISPLTGNEEEWNIVREVFSEGKMIEQMSQNKRNSAVFMEVENGECKYKYIDAIIFKGEEEYDQFTGKAEDISSQQRFNKFPFTPKRFYVDVYKVFYDEEPSEDVRYFEGYDENDKKVFYSYKIKDRAQVEEALNYYNN